MTILTQYQKAGENHALMQKLLRRIQKVAELTSGPDNEVERKRRESLTQYVFHILFGRGACSPLYLPGI